MPTLYIITGSNGAGKSSIGPIYLPEEIQQRYKVFDGDLLYTQKLRELFPRIVKSAKYARQQAFDFVVETFEQQVSQALTHNDNYVYEGHFTNDQTWDVPRKFKAAGYRINLMFFGLENIELSQFRVTERVTEGGHYVDTQTLRNNFYGNMEKLNQHHLLIDDLTIIDASENRHRILLKTTQHNIEYSAKQNEVPLWFKQNLPAIFKMLSR